MALPQFKKLPADRQKHLTDAAEFAAKGYEGATLEAATESVGIGKTSIYYYYADKADLCTMVAENAWGRLGYGGHIDLAARTTDTFWPTVEAMSREILDQCAREPWLLAASKLLNWLPRDPAASGVLDEYVRAWSRRTVADGPAACRPAAGGPSAAPGSAGVAPPPPPSDAAAAGPVGATAAGAPSGARPTETRPRATAPARPRPRSAQTAAGVHGAGGAARRAR
jgi:AcrR family transcriptional regulator